MKAVDDEVDPFLFSCCTRHNMEYRNQTNKIASHGKNLSAKFLLMRTRSPFALNFNYTLSKCNTMVLLLLLLFLLIATPHKLSTTADKRGSVRMEPLPSLVSGWETSLGWSTTMSVPLVQPLREVSRFREQMLVDSGMA